MTQRSPQSWWSRLGELGRRLETFLLTVLLGGLIVFASAQILLRNVFSIGITWGDGLTRLAVLWLALLGAVAASRDDRHIKMELIARFLPPSGQRVAYAITDLFAATIAGLFAWHSWVFVSESREFRDTLLGDTPAWVLQIIMPVAFAVIAYRFVLHAVRQLKAS